VKIALYCAFFVFAAALATAQPASLQAFEVSSVRVSQPGHDTTEFDPGSLTMRSVTLWSCIRWAYRVQDFQMSGPGWLNEVWFDINAKTAGPAKEAEIRKMLQDLLAERFKLTIHRENKEMETLVLTEGKGGNKLQPVEKEGSPSFRTGKMSLTGQGATLSQLTEFLSREMHYPVIDQTGLQGRFNYTLDINAYVTEEMMKTASQSGGPPPDAPSIIAQALQAQLGLKMSSKRAPIEIIVIDHVEKAPIVN
jgi:uncharacterized protein (TIGR03435 family)